MNTSIKYIDSNLLSYKYVDILPNHDNCWAITTGNDGKIYFSVCAESTPALTAHLCVYDPQKDTLRDIGDVIDVIHEKKDIYKAPQCKIHRSMCVDKDGRVWMATHCSAPQFGEVKMGVWQTYGDPIRGYSGAYILVYDPDNDIFLSKGIVAPHQGISAMDIDKEREKLYFATFPKAHFYVYDIKTGEVNDKGRVSFGKPEALLCDPKDGRVYFSGHEGTILRYDPDKDILEELPIKVPTVPWRRDKSSGEAAFELIKAPDGYIYGSVTYTGHLFRFDPEKTDHIEDLGIIIGEDIPNSRGPHCEAIALGKDGNFYLGVGFRLLTFDVDKSTAGASSCNIVRYNPITNKKADMGKIFINGEQITILSEATTGHNGDIYFVTGDKAGDYLPLVIFHPPKEG